MNKRKVGFIGAGYMGFGMAKNLIKNFDVYVISHQNKNVYAPKPARPLQITVCTLTFAKAHNFLRPGAGRLPCERCDSGLCVHFGWVFNLFRFTLVFTLSFMFGFTLACLMLTRQAWQAWLGLSRLVPPCPSKPPPP